MAYINGNEILFSANVDISGASPELEGRVNALEASVGTLEKEVDFLKLVNEGHTYAFSTETETASVRAIPSNSLPYAVLEKVCGRTTKYDEVYGAGYAPYPDFAYRPLNAITIRGKNLLNTNGFVLGSIDSNTGENNTVYYIFRLAERMPIYGGNLYTVSCAKGYDLRHIYFYDANETFISSVWVNRVQKYTLTAPTNAAYFNICFEPTGVSSATKFTNEQAETIKSECKVQVEYGESATEYTPYREPFTYTIPQEIKNLAGYGHGISDAVCNYIDFENKQYVQMCETRSYEESDSERTDVIICAGIDTCAPLTTPIVTNIANYLQEIDNTIAVQGGGLICFDFALYGCGNGAIADATIADAAAAPSTITYQLKL